MPMFETPCTLDNSCALSSPAVSILESSNGYQRCIQSASLRPGTHLFFFWTQRILNEGSNWTQKKIECLCKLQTPRKNSVTRYANLCFVKTIFVN